MKLAFKEIKKTFSLQTMQTIKIAIVVFGNKNTLIFSNLKERQIAAACRNFFAIKQAI